MEEDSNFVNKIPLGIRLMHTVEARNEFPDELFGSRYLHEVVEITLYLTLTSDIMRQFRRLGTITGSDAASCYDRIVHSVVILISRYAGLNLIPLLFLFGLIQHMNYFFRTRYGESTTSALHEISPSKEHAK